MEHGEPRDDERAWDGEPDADDLERASENVLEGWPSTPPVDEPDAVSYDGQEHESAEEDAPSEVATAQPPVDPSMDGALASLADTSAEHAPGELVVPPGYPLLEGEPKGGRRAVGIVVSRFNGDVTGRLLDSALEELANLGVEPASITVMPVPGAFELPIAAMALAKTRRFACVVALGCVIRGDTPHFDYVAGEAASGLQLAAIETGVPVAFGVLTLDRADQAEQRFAKGAEAVRTALEMADLFSNLRAAAAR
jgi:6,7-dimethyl-8-ribityllumazine synthase